MTEIGGDDVDPAERAAADAEILKGGWQATIDEMKALAAEYEDDGWEAHYVAAGDTAPRPPDIDDRDYWGIVHVVPDNFADDFEDAIERGRFDENLEYDVFRNEVEGRVFLVTVLRDPDSRIALLYCGQFLLMDAANLVEHVREVGHVFTHLKRLDGSFVGSFRHEAPEKFFPHYHEFDQFFDRGDAV